MAGVTDAATWPLKKDLGPCFQRTTKIAKLDTIWPAARGSGALRASSAPRMNLVWTADDLRSTVDDDGRTAI